MMVFMNIAADGNMSMEAAEEMQEALSEMTGQQVQLAPLIDASSMDTPEDRRELIGSFVDGRKMSMLLNMEPKPLPRLSL